MFFINLSLTVLGFTGLRQALMSRVLLTFVVRWWWRLGTSQKLPHSHVWWVMWCQLGWQLLVATSAQPLVSVCSLGFLTKWQPHAKGDCPDTERQPVRSTVAFYGPALEFTEHLFCCMTKSSPGSRAADRLHLLS